MTRQKSDPIDLLHREEELLGRKCRLVNFHVTNTFQGIEPVEIGFLTYRCAGGGNVPEQLRYAVTVDDDIVNGGIL